MITAKQMHPVPAKRASLQLQTLARYINAYRHLGSVAPSRRLDVHGRFIGQLFTIHTV